MIRVSIIDTRDPLTYRYVGNTNTYTDTRTDDRPENLNKGWGSQMGRTEEFHITILYYYITILYYYTIFAHRRWDKYREKNYSNQVKSNQIKETQGIQNVH